MLVKFQNKLNKSVDKLDCIIYYINIVINKRKASLLCLGRLLITIQNKLNNC